MTFSYWNKNSVKKSKHSVSVFAFFGIIFPYIALRIRQLYYFSFAFFLVFADLVGSYKFLLVRNMFWGRGSFYRTAFHITIAFLTILIIFSGISAKLNVFSTQASSIAFAASPGGRDDIFAQSGSIDAITSISDDESDYPIYYHTVVRSDNLTTISQTYNVSVNTIIWANGLQGTGSSLSVGSILKVPGLNGAFATVQKGDTVDIIAKRMKGTVPDILDFNSTIVDAENPVLAVGTQLFVPDGILPDPPKKNTVGKPGGRGVVNPGSSPVLNVPPGTFIHPLINCPGFTYIRGYKPSHKGVDMAKNGGCWISASADGVVIDGGPNRFDAGGAGFYLAIDHGNGVHTLYFHGNGVFAVKVGDHVKAGQKIMYMGCTGHCTGTHLHFDFRINNARLNPEKYVFLRHL